MTEESKFPTELTLLAIEKDGKGNLIIYQNNPFESSSVFQLKYGSLCFAP